MRKILLRWSILALLLPALAAVSACRQQQSPAAIPAGPHTVRVAQSAPADVVGADNLALQQAADLLRPGDTLEIGPGAWNMENSLVIPVSGVVVRGTPDETILKKGPGYQSIVADGGDWGEPVLVLAEPANFKPGMGISFRDDRNAGGYNVTTGTITEMRADTIRISELPCCDYDYLEGNARVQNNFPILAAFGQRELLFEGITVDGNLEQNPYALDGCRGGAFYLFQCKNSEFRNCVARNYNGDGFSYQITDSVRVVDCEAYGNSGLGVHPGTGSPRTLVSGSHMHDNGQIGLFLCYRVRYGEFRDNLIENNGSYGISIGHKDSDNLFENNVVRGNGIAGVFFRHEDTRVAGHRNVFRNNKIVDNGGAERGYGVLVRKENNDLVFENNTIEDTRQGEARTQRYGIFVEKGSHGLTLTDNTLQGHLLADVQEEELD